MKKVSYLLVILFFTFMHPTTNVYCDEVKPVAETSSNVVTDTPKTLDACFASCSCVCPCKVKARFEARIDARREMRSCDCVSVGKANYEREVRWYKYRGSYRGWRLFR